MTWYSIIHDHVSSLATTGYQIVSSNSTSAYDFLTSHNSPRRFQQQVRQGNKQTSPADEHLEKPAFSTDRPAITAKPTDPQISSLFFTRLPPELRALIYHHVLSAYTPPGWRNPNTAPWCLVGRLDGLQSNRKCDPRLLRACRRMYLEALQSVYAPHSFLFPEAKDAYHFIRQIGALSRAQLRTVYVASAGLSGEKGDRAWVDIDAAFAMLGACENLRELWIGAGVWQFDKGVGGRDQEGTVLPAHPVLDLRGLKEFGFMRGPITSLYEKKVWIAPLTPEMESVERRIREVVTSPRSNNV